MRSEEKFRKMFNLMADPVVIVDEKGTLLAVNDRVKEITQFSKQELLGKNFLRTNVVTAKSKAILIKNLVKRMAGMHIKPYEIEVLTKDRKRIPFEVNATKIEYDGKPADLVVFRDIAERKRMEEELRRYSEHLEELVEERTRKLKESKMHFQTLFNAMVDPVVIVDEKGKILEVSDRLIEKGGFKKEELVGKNFLRTKGLTAKSKAIALKNLAKRMMGKEITPYEVEMLTKDGKKIPVEVNAAKIEYMGKPAVMAVFRGIAERKRMEEELRRYSEHLEELVEERTKELREAQERFLKAERLAAIGETAAMVGHDLRNPLQVITNAIYILKRSVEKIESTVNNCEKTIDFLPKPNLGQIRQGIRKCFEMIRTIEESVNYANKIVSDLQDYARPAKPKLVETNIHELFNDTLSTMKVPERVKVSIMIEEDFPKLMIDYSLMKRAFANLLTNAVQAMPDGGKLTIRASKTDEAAFISVEDTGVGISEENLAKLFQPLFTTKAKGQGFGLPVCKRIVEAHNGRITVKSKMGEGSTFTIQIPLRNEVDQRGKGEKRVLFVDGRLDFRTL